MQGVKVAYFLMLFGIVFIHTQQSSDFILANGSEPAFYIDVRLRRTHIFLARYRSPGIKSLLARSKFIKVMMQGAKTDGFIFACLFSIFGIVSIHT